MIIYVKREYIIVDIISRDDKINYINLMNIFSFDP